MKVYQEENEISQIKAFKNGDPIAFKKLFYRYHTKLYAFSFHLLGSKEDAEEIVQETFIKIWEKRSEFIEGYPFRSFLFGIAKNVYLNMNRKKVTRKIFEERSNLLNELSSINTDDYILFQETRDIINTIIEGLPPKRKEIFLLRRMEGLSRQEIAEKLGISVITVDNQLTKVNAYLKIELKKYGLIIFILLFIR